MKYAMSTAQLDPETERAARVFLERIKSRFNVAGAIPFGSRARRTHRLDSDADIAVIIGEPHGKRSAAAIDMAGVAFVVLLETDVLVEALPLWEEGLIHPEYFSYPDLIENFRRESIRMCVWLLKNILKQSFESVSLYEPQHRPVFRG